jgi:hypothetical protein
VTVSAPANLAETLSAISEGEYARFVADWLTRATDLDTAPALTGDRVIDALVAAAAAHLAMTIGRTAPAWASEPTRTLENYWYAGPPGFFANAVVHSPLAFAIRGVLIEADSLESV